MVSKKDIEDDLLSLLELADYIRNTKAFSYKGSGGESVVVLPVPPANLYTAGSVVKRYLPELAKDLRVRTLERMLEEAKKT